MGTHAVHFEWSGLCRISFGAAVPQNMLFLLLTYPNNKEWASSLNHMSLRKLGFCSILLWNHWHVITLSTLSPGMSLCCTCILQGYRRKYTLFILCAEAWEGDNELLWPSSDRFFWDFNQMKFSQPQLNILRGPYSNSPDTFKSCSCSVDTENWIVPVAWNFVFFS